MMSTRVPFLALVLLALFSSSACRLGAEAASTSAPAPEWPRLDGLAVHEWAARLEPAAKDRAWLEIPWHASFHDGLQAADAADRPLLLWLMNGHPLGCT